MRHPAVEQQMPLSAADRGEIDLVALFREIGRRKWQVMLCTVGALVLSTAAVNVLKPRYTAETRVFLENRDTEYTRIGRDPSRGPDAQIDQDAILSQVQIMQSRDIARAVSERFDLGSLAEFDSMRNGVDGLTKLGVMLGLLNNPAQMSPEERVLERYFDKLKAFAVAKSRVIAIEFQSSDPELAAKITGAIAEEYIAQLEKAKRDTAKSAGSWLGRTIESLRERVAVAEAKVEAYRSQNGLFLVGSAGNNTSSSSTISTQQLSDLNTQLGTARAQQTELMSKARQIREAVRQGRIFEISDVVNNEVVRRLLETRATLKAQIAQEERSLLPQHPRIKELHAQLGGLEDQVRAAAERTARTLENDARTAGARVAAMQGELDLQKRQNSTSNDQEVQLRALEREAKAEREQLENYLARYRDAASREGDNAVTADARIVSRAIAPGMPSFPKKLPTILIATLAGFVISLFWVLTKALLSDRVYARRTPETTSAQTMMPMAYPGMMPGMTMPVATHAPYNAPQVADPSVVATAPQHTAVEAAGTEPLLTPEQAAAIATPTPEPALNLPEISETSMAMRASLERMTQTLQANMQPLEKAEPIHGTFADDRGLSQQIGFEKMQSPPMVPLASDLSDPMHDEETIPTGADGSSRSGPSREIHGIAWKDDASGLDAYPFDLENPLFEIAEEASSCLIRGRPVTILVLSVESAGHAAQTVRALDTILKREGPTISATLDAAEITPVNLIAAAKSLAGSHDFAVFNGGEIDSWSRELSHATMLTVLVASDDLDDPRTEKASAVLNGCNYFIVGAQAAISLS